MYHLPLESYLQFSVGHLWLTVLVSWGLLGENHGELMARVWLSSGVLYMHIVYLHLVLNLNLAVEIFVNLVPFKIHCTFCLSKIRLWGH